jgi:aldose 1-epimerase
MYSLVSVEEAFILQSPSSKVEILPGCGAILNRWTVAREGEIFELIDGYESPEDFRQNCEAKGFRSAKLSPYVCRINNSGYHFEGVKYEIGKYKLSGVSIHGLVYNNSFRVINTLADEKAAALVLQHNYDGSDRGYPFTYQIQISYVLQFGNHIGITTLITNTSKNHIPIADGWHPYFSLGKPVDELYLQMQTNAMLKFNDALIPTGELVDYSDFNEPKLLANQFFDNCFLLNKPLQGAACRLINRLANITLSVYPDNSYPYLQVYTPPHRQSIAIENLSAAPDAFNNHIGLIILSPGESRSFTTQYVVS